MNLAEEDASYRRGTVLGLTFAEIMLLLLFVLLLALSFHVQQREKEVTTARDALAEQERQNQSLSEQLAKAGVYKDIQRQLTDAFLELTTTQNRARAAQQEAEALRKRNQELSDAFIELQVVRGEIERQGKVIEALGKKADAWDQLTDTIGGEPNTDKLIANVQAGAENKAIADAVRNSGLVSDPSKLKSAIDAVRELEILAKQAIGDKAKLADQLKYFVRRAGLSNELPPCWINASSSQPEYIFDIVLGSSGITIYERAPDYRKPEMAKLPLEKAVYGKPLGIKDFQGAYRPLYDWSDGEKCRFFVRAFDRTPEQEKELYKNLLRTTEGFFYKYLISDRSITPGQKDD